jgi:glutathione S-transferase
MKLHVGTPNLSSWSLRPYLVLAHIGCPFQVRVIDLDRPDTRATILAGSPAGRVPFLVHDGLLVWDSLAICEYLADTFPEAQLWPIERDARARARSVSAEMHSGFAALRQNMPMNIRARFPGQGHTPEALADAARVMEIWRDCRARAPEGPFLFGRFTIADAMFAPVTTRFTTYDVPVDDTARAYIDAIAELPAMESWRALTA